MIFQLTMASVREQWTQFFDFIVARTSVPITFEARVEMRRVRESVESARNTRNRLKMKGERQRRSSVLMTAVGGPCCSCELVFAVPCKRNDLTASMKHEFTIRNYSELITEQNSSNLHKTQFSNLEHQIFFLFLLSIFLIFNNYNHNDEKKQFILTFRLRITYINTWIGSRLCIIANIFSFREKF